MILDHQTAGLRNIVETRVNGSETLPFYNIKLCVSEPELIPCFSSFPAVSLCFGTDDGCGVFHVGGSQPSLHWDAYGPGKALWVSLGVISE